jgi:hypothetical protein
MDRNLVNEIRVRFLSDSRRMEDFPASHGFHTHGKPAQAVGDRSQLVNLLDCQSIQNLPERLLQNEVGFDLACLAGQ